MPNWCECVITVRGKTPEDLRSFVEAVKGENTDLSLQKLVPCPQELQNTTSSFVSSLDPVDNERIIRENAKQQNWGLSEEKLKEIIEEKNKIIAKFKSNTEKYGYKDWYDFNIEKWGTKWDVEANINEVSDTEVMYTFESAWSPPTAWLEQVGPMFPKCKFLMEYREPGVGFEGTIYVYGDIFKDDCIERGSPPIEWLEEFDENV